MDTHQSQLTSCLTISKCFAGIPISRYFRVTDECWVCYCRVVVGCWAVHTGLFPMLLDRQMESFPSEISSVPHALECDVSVLSLTGTLQIKPAFPLSCLFPCSLVPSSVHVHHSCLITNVSLALASPVQFLTSEPCP